MAILNKYSNIGWKNDILKVHKVSVEALNVRAENNYCCEEREKSSFKVSFFSMHFMNESLKAKLYCMAKSSLFLCVWRGLPGKENTINSFIIVKKLVSVVILLEEWFKKYDCDLSFWYLSSRHRSSPARRAFSASSPWASSRSRSSPTPPWTWLREVFW